MPALSVARPICRAVPSTLVCPGGDGTKQQQAMQQQLQQPVEQQQQLGRRALLLVAGCAGLAAVGGMAQPASAAPQTQELEPMEALKGKDYGKSRMR